MSVGFNRVLIIGFLGHDPEIRYTQAGIAVTTLNIAISEKHKVNDDWIDHTDWFNIVCLGKSAENVGKYLKKGRQIFVEGKLQNRLWEDKNGNSHIITEVITKKIIFLGRQEFTKKIKTENEKSKPKDLLKDDIPF